MIPLWPVSLSHSLKPKPKTIKVEINHRRRIKGEHLAENETSDDGDPQGPA